MQILPPICLECQHFRKGAPLSCDAYPDGIPNEILYSKVDHHIPYKGDHGIQFKEKPESHTQKDEPEQITCGQGRFL